MTEDWKGESYIRTAAVPSTRLTESIRRRALTDGKSRPGQSGKRCEKCEKPLYADNISNRCRAHRTSYGGRRG